VPFGHPKPSKAGGGGCPFGFDKMANNEKRQRVEELNNR